MGSEYFEQRRQAWADPKSEQILRRYRTLYAATDFYIAFRFHSEFQAMFPGDFESFGRQVGLSWCFDHSATPRQFLEYLDLLTEPQGCFLTVVRDGAFSFNANVANGSWGLVHQGWQEVLYTIQADYYDSRLEGGPASLRYCRLIKLLEAQCGGIVD